MESTISGSGAALTGEGIAGCTLSLTDSIENISPSLWNEQIPPGNLLMQYDYLKLIEDTQGSNLGFRYMIVRREERIIGVLYFQVVLFMGGDLLNYFPENPTGWSKYLVSALKTLCRILFSNIRAKLLVTGNIFMTGEAGIYFQPGIDLAVRAQLLRKAINEITAADKQIRAVVVSDLYEPKTAFDTGFEECDYHTILLEPDMSIKMREEWKSFHDYLHSFSSKYRVRAKRVYSLSSEIVQRELTEDEIGRYEDTLYSLYLKVMENADFKLGIFTKQYFREQKKQLPENYRLFAYFRGEEMLGFISVFISGKKMDIHYIGMDNDNNKDLHLYQRMMYDMIDIGIAYRAERLHFGRTAPEIKSTVGASPMATHGYIKHLNPVINFLIMRPLTAYLKPKEYVFRNPFKN